MRDKRILVTGGAGFIGSNLASHLADRNDVIAVDNGYLGTPENLDDQVRFENRSILDDELPTNPNVVFHLAALSSYGMHERDPTQGARVKDDIAHGRPPRIFGDGAQTRDFTHVDDIVCGTELAADAYEFNDGVERIAEELGADVEPEHVENPIPGRVYVRDTCADPSKMIEATGREPQVSFEEGIRRVCEPYWNRDRGR